MRTLGLQRLLLRGLALVLLASGVVAQEDASPTGTSDVPTVRLTLGRAWSALVSGGAEGLARLEVELPETESGFVELYGVSMDGRVVLVLDGDDAGELSAREAESAPETPLPARLVLAAEDRGRKVRVEHHATQGRLVLLALAPSRANRPETRGAMAVRSLGEVLVEDGRPGGAARCLYQSGATFMNHRELAAAHRASRAALAPAREAGDLTLLTASLAQLGAVNVQLGDLEAAQPALEAARQGAVALNDRGLQAFVSLQLGATAVGLGRSEEAHEHLLSALGTYQSLGQPANEFYVRVQLEVLARGAGDHAEARVHLDRMEAIAREANSIELAVDALIARANYHEERLELGPARAALEEALEYVTNARQRAGVLGTLSQVELHSGRYREAFVHIEEALATGRELGDERLVALSRKTEGTLLLRIGDLEGARRVLEEARHGLEAAALSERAGVARELAMLLSQQDDRAGSDRLFEEALEFASRAGGEALSVAVMAARASVLHDQGRFVEGLEWTEAALATLGPELTPIRATVLCNRAEFLVRLGQLDGVAEDLAVGLSALRGVGYHRVVLRALSTEIELALARGDVEWSHRVLDEAEALVHRPDLDRLGPEAGALMRSRINYVVFGEFHHELLALELGRPSLSEEDRRAIVAQGFERSAAWKGRGLLQGMVEHRAGRRNAATTELRRLRQQALVDHEVTLTRLQQALRSGANPEEVEALRQGAAVLAERAGGLLVRLEREAPWEAALDLPRGVSPVEVQAQVLAPGGALLDFVEGRERLYAYRLDQDRLDFVELGSRIEIEALILEFLRLVSASGTSPASIADAGQELYRALLAPLVGMDPQGPLIVIPAPGMAAVPFEALVVAAPEHATSFSQLEFLIDRTTVTYGPTASTLDLLARLDGRDRHGPVLVLADPVYPRESGRPAVSRAPAPLLALERLPGTRSEALGIADVLIDRIASLGDGGDTEDARDQLERLAQTRSGSLNTEMFDLHLGSSASPSVLDGDLRRYAVIHCATHGIVDLADSRRSGLVLANRGEDGGYLTLTEVLDLDLDADLAVLSACETSRGAVVRGEGVQSMARAFLYAGARSVVASLWQVSDEATSETMRRFYEGYLGRDEDRAAALREARLALRSGAAPIEAVTGRSRGRPLGGPAQDDLTGHPFYWAPFIHVGLSR